jgi:hypothetical protein
MENMTAVEWLFEQVVNLDWRNLQGEEKKKIFDQAKQMEQEQIVTANADGQYLQSDFLSKNQCYRNAEDYYTETFKN